MNITTGMVIKQQLYECTLLAVIKKSVNVHSNGICPFPKHNLTILYDMAECEIILAHILHSFFRPCLKMLQLYNIKWLSWN
jgi:hypothetical protein